MFLHEFLGLVKKQNACMIMPGLDFPILWKGWDNCDDWCSLFVVEPLKK
jgi:hypothetical protein